MFLFFPESAAYTHHHTVVEIDDETSKWKMETRKERLTYFCAFIA